MAGAFQPVPVLGDAGGRITGDILTMGLAEAFPSNIKEPFYNTMGSALFSPAAGLAAGGAGLLAGGGMSGLAGAGMGAAPSTAGSAGAGASGATGLEGLAQFTNPALASPTVTPISTMATGGATGAGLGGGTLPQVPTAPAGLSALEKAFLATQTGSILGQAFRPLPQYGPPSTPSAPTVSGGGFRPVSGDAMQQLAQLMAQRRNQQGGTRFTV